MTRYPKDPHGLCHACRIDMPPSSNHALLCPRYIPPLWQAVVDAIIAARGGNHSRPQTEQEHAEMLADAVMPIVIQAWRTGAEDER